MKRTTYIYCLVCPLECRVRYVGQSVQPMHRYFQHLNCAKNILNKYPDDWEKEAQRLSSKDRWIVRVLHEGEYPQLLILEGLEKASSDAANAAEQRWIDVFHAADHPLTNREISLQPPPPKGVSLALPAITYEQQEARPEHFRGSIAGGIRHLRKRHAMTQEELAKRCGVGVSTIIRAEQGAVEPHPTTVRKVAAALGVSPQELTRLAQ